MLTNASPLVHIFSGFLIVSQIFSYFLRFLMFSQVFSYFLRILQVFQASAEGGCYGLPLVHECLSFLRPKHL